MFFVTPRALATITAPQVLAVVRSKLGGSRAAANKIIVDVRSTGEVAATGLIPTAVNIPLKALPAALSDEVDEEEFVKTFGHPKPRKDEAELIFYCERGVRSATATEIAEGLGYRYVKNFVGSFAEWRECYGGAPFDDADGCKG
ncbi:hypothetical protein, conserved [Trypanosoma brucei gambiense DAL972]|uniref:Rhodanese domain-containing protein n=2 Tax=Trypanosoma brucei TaxID=5691 RepID=D0A9Q0_TRYB9|nr:hypothetical protein, conserved [Trypanosoma brucei gambiense DAL972]RHW68152.1 rhodanese-like domain containing protein [Trypanosoma brucei equiperdum]CBH18401.1 hypothetical protein, conserved [Trypanosoma brucei gambiense DAL972]|eukprot:XP_011780665.1 hypothetical protein, conserved [Trypanosoma brucei gambiense DAL972]